MPVFPVLLKFLKKFPSYIYKLENNRPPIWVREKKQGVSLHKTKKALVYSDKAGTRLYQATGIYYKSPNKLGRGA